MIKYILDDDLYFREYVANYTNAPFIVGPAFDFKDGLFSGYNPDTRKYDKSKWAFEMDVDGVPKMDRTLLKDFLPRAKIRPAVVPMPVKIAKPLPN